MIPADLLGGARRAPPTPHAISRWAGKGREEREAVQGARERRGPGPRDAWEEGDGHRLKPKAAAPRREGGGRKTFPNGVGALHDHFKHGPGAMLRTTVDESAARAAQSDRRPGSSRSSAASPRIVMDSSARGSHFKGGAMMLQTGAGMEQFLRVR